MHLAQLIKDLAVILITAGIITIVFRKIKQPVVLGYIAAGFILGPHVDLFVGIVDSEAIEIWGEIGVIMLMFCHGLDFSLHKLARVRRTAITAALNEIVSMMLLALLMCRVLGWSAINAVFIGSMLAMSSTAIVFKAFHDLKLKDEYTSFASGILVIKDLAGVFLILACSAFTPEQGFRGIGTRLWVLAAMIVLWLVLGIYLIPTLFNRSIHLMSSETLMIISLATCFGMVLVADALEVPAAFGAYLAGALLAGTLHAERIEHVVDPIRDLFGAAFFISVGMLLDPAVVSRYWLLIAVTTVLTIVGKQVFTAAGVLLSGKTLKNAVQTACAIAQVGEFAFIIAQAGVSSGVLSQDMYSIIVVISVVSTVATPYLIRHSESVYGFYAAILPKSLVEKHSREGDDEAASSSSSRNVDVSWRGYMIRYAKRCVVYGLLMLSISLLFYYAIHPLMMRLPVSEKTVFVADLILCYFLIAIFIRPMLDRLNPLYYGLWDKDVKNRVPLLLLQVLRYLLLAALLQLPLYLLGNGAYGVYYVPVVLVIILFVRLDWFPSAYLRLEARFLANYNERRNADFADTQRTRQWLDESLDLTEYICGPDEDGKTLIELDWGRRYGVDVFQVDIDGVRHNMPNGTMRMQSGAKLYLLGEPESIRSFRLAMGFSLRGGTFELREFIAEQEPGDDALFCYLIKVDKDSVFLGKTIRGSGVRRHNDCMVIGLQRSGMPIAHPNPNFVVEKDDILWLLGTTAIRDRYSELQEL